MRDRDRTAGLDLRLEFRHHRSVRRQHIAEPHRDQPHLRLAALLAPPDRDRAPGNTSRRTAWSAPASKPARSPCRSRSSPSPSAPAASAASATLTDPKMLVLTPSLQSRSRIGTCLSAAAWNTMSGLNSLISRRMRSRSRMSAIRPSMAAPVSRAASVSVHRIERRLGILDHQQPRGAERHDAVADLRADRTAAAGDDHRLALHQGFQTRVVDLHAGTQQQVLDRDIGQARRVTALQRRQAADDQPQPARPHQHGLGMRVGFERRRRHHRRA